MNRADPPTPSGEWALVGRAEELYYVRRARRGEASAVVIGGAQGVGRSRLAAEAAAAARTERWASEHVDGTTATASIPFGAVAHLAPPGTRGGDALGLLLGTTDHLRTRAARRPLMIVIDDAHHLDEASLALVRRLIGLPSLFLLLTVRSDEPVPTPVVGLWKDGHARRLELQPLSRHETHHLVARSRGGEIDPATARWLWDHSLGNPLFLRELLLSGHGDDTAPRSAAPAVGVGSGPRLAELVRTRLGRLDDHQRTALETIAVGGPLPADLVGAVVPPDAVASLVSRGLLVERDDSPEPLLALAHPVYGVVLAGELTAPRARQLRSRVLALVEQRGDTSPRSTVLSATLRLDQGVDLDAQQLVVASRYAQAAFPQALAARLPAPGNVRIDEITAAVARAEPAERPSHHDLAVAERLARAAWDTDRSLSSGLALTTILVARGSGPDAAALTTQLDAQARSGPERVQLTLARAALQFWVLGQADGALELLRSAEEATDDAVAHSRLRRLRAGIALNVGRVDEAADLATELIDQGDQPPPLAAMAAATASAALAIGGRPAAAAAMVDRFLPVALTHAAEISEVLGQLLLARLFAARVLGDLDEAEALAYACYQPAAEQGSLAGMAVFTASLGQIALDRGQPATAARRLREADVLLSEYDTFGYRPWVLACLAMAQAQAGDGVAAGGALDRARAVTTQARYFDSDLVLADAWCLAADGRTDEAAAHAGAAATQARTGGVAPFEAAALHALVRLGRPQPARARLGSLAETTASPLVALFAGHAAALEDGDGAGLDQVAAGFDRLGAMLWAAEAAAQASAAHDRAGHGADAARSRRRSTELADACPSAATPALREAVAAPDLTAREREIALLTTQGLTSKAIAERLTVSPRTVESHLYRIFAKLGIAGRGELSDVLGGTRPAPPL